MGNGWRADICVSALQNRTKTMKRQVSGVQVMNFEMLTDYFLEYGAVFIFLIVFLEYLNLTGFPAGVIMPTAGIWAA